MGKIFLAFWLLAAVFVVSPHASARSSSPYEKCLPTEDALIFSLKAKELTPLLAECQNLLKDAQAALPETSGVVINLSISVARMAYITRDYDLARHHIAAAKAKTGVDARRFEDRSRTDLALTMLDILVGDGDSKMEDVVARARALADARPYHIDAQKFLLELASRTISTNMATAAISSGGHLKKSVYDDVAVAQQRLMQLQPSFGMLSGYVAVQKSEGNEQAAVDALRHWVGTGKRPRSSTFLRLAELAYEMGNPDLGATYYNLARGGVAKDKDNSWHSALFPEFPKLKKEPELFIPPGLVAASTVDAYLKDLLGGITALEEGDTEKANRFGKHMRCGSKLCYQFKRDLARADGDEAEATNWQKKLENLQSGLTVTRTDLFGADNRMENFVRLLDVVPTRELLDAPSAPEGKVGKQPKRKLKVSSDGLTLTGAISDQPSFGKAVIPRTTRTFGGSLNVSPSAWLYEKLILTARDAAAKKGAEAIMLMDTSGIKMKKYVTAELHFTLTYPNSKDVANTLVPWRLIATN